VIEGNMNDLTQQRLSAIMLIEMCDCEKLDLVRVRYPNDENIPDRISIIGHSISHGALAVWKAQGAVIEHIETLTRENENEYY